jgi:hypothetical protein
MEESSHAIIVNSAALKLTKITKQSPHPPGGRIMFDDKTGQPNGILFDNAGDIVMEQAWNSHPKRAKRLLPMRKVFESGANVTFSSHSDRFDRGGEICRFCVTRTRYYPPQRRKN